MFFELSKICSKVLFLFTLKALHSLRELGEADRGGSGRAEDACGSGSQGSWGSSQGEMR